MSDLFQRSENKLQLILCANAQDAAACKQAGFKSVRVVDQEQSLFVSSTEGFELDPNLEIFGSFVIAAPTGMADWRDQVAMRLGDVRCRWVDWGADAGSASEALRRGGAERLREALTRPRPMWTDEVCTLRDIPEPEPQKTYITGFKKLDEHGFRLVRPAFMPVIGPYGSGKSVLLRQLSCNLYRMYGWRTLITSFEERVKPRYVRDLRRHLIGHEDMDNYGELRWTPKNPQEFTAADIKAADDTIEKAFRFLRRKRGAMLCGDRLLDLIEYAVRVYGLEMVIIDPVNEIDHQIPKGMTRTDYFGGFIMRFKQLCDDYDLLGIIALHPPKESVEKRSQKGKLMTLNDGADTAHWGNKADIGWCVWRPTLDGPTYLHIDKLKDHEVMGDPTLCRLDLDKGYGRFAVTKIGYDIFEELEG